MPKRNPQLMAERNPTICLRRSPRFLSENRNAVEHLGTSKRSARKQSAPESFFTPPCSRIAKTQKNVSGASRDRGKKEADTKILGICRRKSARLDSRAAFSCLELQKQCVVEKRVTRSSTGGIKQANYKDCEWDEIPRKRGREIKSLGKSSKGTKSSAKLEDRALVCQIEGDTFPHKQYLIEKRLTRSSLRGNKVVIEMSDSDRDSEEDSKERVRVLSKDRKSKVGGDSCKKTIGNIEKRVSRSSSDERKHRGDDELSKLYTNKKDAQDCGVTMISCDKNGKRTQGEKSKRHQVGEEGNVDHGWTKEQDLSLRRAYFVAKPTPQFWREVARMVPGKSAKECFDRIHSDQSTPSQPLTRSRPKRKQPSPILFSPSKLLNPAEIKSKKRISKMRTLAAQKTARKLLQKQHTEDQDYEADLFSVLEPTFNPSPLNLQEGTQFSSPAPNQGSSLAHGKQRFRLNSSQKVGFASPPILKQIKNKALHEKYIDQLHCRDAKRKAAALRKAKNVNENVSLLKPNLVKVAKDALVSDAQEAINRLRSLQSGKDYSIDDDNTCSSDEDEDEDDDEFC